MSELTRTIQYYITGPSEGAVYVYVFLLHCALKSGVQLAKGKSQRRSVL